MSQNKDDKNAPRPSADASLPKRPVPTIDLKATEIKVETKPATGAMGTSTSAPASASGPAVKPGDGKPADVKPQAASSSPATTASATANPDPKSRANPASATVGSRPQASVPPVGATASATGAKASAAAAATSSAALPSAKSGSAIGRALTYLSAAVLGGLLAIFGADYLANSFGIEVRQPAAPSPVVEDLTSRLKKLEQSAAQSPAVRPEAAAVKAVAEQVGQANERLAKLESERQQLAALSQAQAKIAETTRTLEAKLAAPPAVPADAAERLGKLEETIQGLAALAQAQPGRPLPELARLSGKLGEIETAVAALRKNGGGDAVAQIEARLAEARKAEAQMSETVAQLKAENTKRLQELEAVKTLAQRLEQRVEAARTDAGTARSSVDALKSDLTTQLQTVARTGELKTSVDGVDKRVAGIETRVEALAKRDDERQANSERIVVSLQLANLKRALDQGKPYGEALAEMEKVTGGLADLAPLKPYRDKGVVALPELIAQFRPMARAVLEAEQDRGQASTVDRILQSAKSVVQIRRTGDVKGDGTEAQLARAEQSLKAGDMVATAKEMKGLKAELRGVAQAWLDQLEARVAVDRALKAIEDKLKTSLAGASTPGKGGKP